MFDTSSWTVFVRGKIFSCIIITKTHRFKHNERFNRFTTDQGTSRFTTNIDKKSFTDTNITSVKSFMNGRNNNSFSTAHNTHRFTNAFFTFLHKFTLHWSEWAQFLTKVKFDALIIRSIVTQDGGSLSVTRLQF